MEGAGNGEIPNLSGEVTLWSNKAIFDGSYSSVYRGTLRKEFVAVKVLKEIRGVDVDTMRRKFHRERTIWGRLDHPNVLPLYGFADDHDFFQPFGALISPWRAQGNAYEFLKDKGQSMSPARRLSLWKGVVTGVAYLHNLTPALVHGDLKPLNVLIDNNDQPQICDFGLVSIFLDDGTSGMKTTSPFTGTDRYLSYELVLDELATPTMASDIFALGSVGLEFNFLQLPYAKRKLNRHICSDIKARVPPAKRPEAMDILGGKTWDLLDRCWEQNAADRISARDLLSELETVEALERTTSGTLSFLSLPRLAANYVERNLPMNFIEKALFDEDGRVKPGSKRIIVTGIGGCGKTQLIRKFIEVYNDLFASTFFIDGSNPDTIRRDIVRHVRALGSAHSQKSFDESMVFLSQVLDGQRLLIIDNVDDMTLDLAPFLPRWQNGVVVVTSRSHSRGQLSPAGHLQLDVMTPEESVELLVRGSGQPWPPAETDRKLAVSVAEELGCHPIALVQAVSYMYNTGCSPESYITRLRSHRGRLLRDPATIQVDIRYKTAFAAFDASYNILPPKAQELWHLLSFFRWQGFPIELIPLAAQDGFSTDGCPFLIRGDEFELGIKCLKEIFFNEDQWDLLGLHSILATLRSHSLITTTSAENATLLQTHPLVHEWGRLRISEDRLRHLEAGAVRLLCCGATEDNYSMMQYLSIHAEELASKWDNLHPNDASSLAFILAQSGMYDKAATLDGFAREMVKRELGPDHFNTVTTSENLAVAYHGLGRYAEAEVLQTQALRQRKQLLGEENPDTLAVLAQLADTYHALGRYADAEVLQTDVLRRRKQMLGSRHPDTIGASVNLAVTYQALGRYAEAEELETEALQLLKQVLGVKHPNTIRASARLADTYHALGRYVEAEVLQKEALQQRKQILGTHHPDTIRSMLSLAHTYSATQRRSEAFSLAERALQIASETLGNGHPLYDEISVFLASLSDEKPAQESRRSLFTLFKKRTARK